MKKLIIPFILLFSFNSFASYDCDLPPFNEDKSVSVDTEKCLAADCQGEYITTGTLIWTCADVYSSNGGTTDRIQKIVAAYAPNSKLKNYCFSATDETTVTATVVLYHDEPNLEDECKGFCEKNAGSLGEPTKIESYPTSDDISNGFVSISNGSTYKCNKDDSSSDDACVVRTVAQQSFDGSKITTITQSFLTENQCTGNDGNIDLDTENISLEYCNETGGYYGNQYCDNSDPDYHCPSGDCEPISGGVCEDDGDCNNPDPTDPDTGETGGETGGENGGENGGETGGGSGETGGGSGETETDEGLIAYFESVLNQFGLGNSQANAKYGNQKIQNKNQLQNNSNVVDFSSTSLDESGFISGETCPPPYKLELPFGVFEIPFDFICNFASTISFIVMGLAYVVSARILIGGL